MILNDIDFGHVFNAAGARNFSGQGYPHHKLLSRLCPGFSYQNSTFIAKTVTLHKQAGNLPLFPDSETPREKYPKCIYLNLLKGYTVNAVGLSNAGADDWLFSNIWQGRTQPFVISFMALGANAEQRQAQRVGFLKRLVLALPHLCTKVALQENFSCPNTDLDPAELVSEINLAADDAQHWIPHTPWIPKINCLVPPTSVAKIASHPHCSAISCSNTLPWQDLFPGKISPLRKRGLDYDGGVGGRLLTKLVLDWVKQFRKIDQVTPLMAGGGLLTRRDIRRIIHAGASAIELGSVALLRPWRLQKLIRLANQLLG